MWFIFVKPFVKKKVAYWSIIIKQFVVSLFDVGYRCIIQLGVCCGLRRNVIQCMDNGYVMQMVYIYIYIFADVGF